MKKIIPIFLFVLAMATSAQGGIVVLDYGSAGGADNATIESLIQQSHADIVDNSETRTDQSVTPAGLAYWSVPFEFTRPDIISIPANMRLGK